MTNDDDTSRDPGAFRARFASFVRSTQDDIVRAIDALDPGASFHEDTWDRDGGGGGRSRVLQDGDVFEKAGVNVSEVHGRLSPDAAKAMGGGQALGESALGFWAAGVSLVIHPKNPFQPTAHANYRYFERVADDGSVAAWWFGGGADLTPTYVDADDAIHFHRVHRDACDPHDASYYPRFKTWCDEYFRIAHRGEGRGVGGIFFDDLHGEDRERDFAFVRDCAGAFVPAYVPIVERHAGAPFEARHTRFQQLRRGRYVEFNLVYDRGTVFGLRTAGRIESVLMSLPLTARWEYQPEFDAGSAEAETIEVLREPRDWLT